MADSGMALSKFGVLVAQLNSIIDAASQQQPDALLCFDLLSDLVSTIQDEPKASVLQYQRKCEDLLQSLVILGARRPVRRLASTAILSLIEKGDNISVYSRASAFQGWLSETRKSDPLSYIGAAQCLGDLYRFYGRKITSGMVETSNIITKLMKSSEVGVRQAALQLLQNAIEGSEGAGPVAAYSESFRTLMRAGVIDKSFIVRTAAAGCLKAFATTGGPGLPSGGLEQSASVCVKAMEDTIPSVRDAFAEALGMLLSLGLNPEAQVVSKGKSQSSQPKTVEGGLQKHLIGPFMKATGPRLKDVRVGLTMAWVSFLQGMNTTYLQSDAELQNFALQALDMLHGSSIIDAHAQACVLYILRVGVVEQMSELTQKDFMILLSKQLFLPDTTPSMIIVILRTLSFLLDTLGEVPVDAKEVLDNSLVSTLSNPAKPVRVEAALTLRALSEVDPNCAGGLISSGLTTLRALCETMAIEKGDRLRMELNDFHGHAAMLACLASAARRLPLGIPSRLPFCIFELSKQLISGSSQNVHFAGAVKEAGWMLLAAVISSLSMQELEELEFDVIALWTVPFGGNIEQRLKEAEQNLDSTLCVWSSAMEALTAFVRCYVLPSLTSKSEGIILQPVLGYLSGALAYILSLRESQFNLSKSELDHFTVRTLIAYQTVPNPTTYRSDHVKLLSFCTIPFRDPSSCEESSSLRLMLDHRDASLGPWPLGRDSFEDELRAFEGGSDGPLPCLWQSELPIFPQPVPLSTYLVDHMLLCFGHIFASEGSKKKLQMLESIEHSLKVGKKQYWHAANVTNTCVGLLVGLKASLRLRSLESEGEVLLRLQSIFQVIIAEEGTSQAQRRAAAEGLGLLARLGNDTYAARLARSLIAEANGSTSTHCKGSLALALGCIHRSAGGMALSALLSSTIQSLCTMARDPKDSLRVWSLHGLCLTTEAGGLSCVPYIQSMMALVMDVLLCEEHCITDLHRSIGRLVNAIVAVLGPELSPGSSFFSRCKTVISEIGSGEDPSVLLECVRFTQQLVLFAPQALSVHSHVETLRSTLSSRQPILRQAAISTLRHLAESDSVAAVDERIEEELFSMLDKETDSSIAKLVCRTIDRLLDAACPSCPSRWLQICRNVVLAATTKKYQDTASLDSETRHGSESLGDDYEGMIVNPIKDQGSFFCRMSKLDQMPRFRTRVYAAQCLSRIPDAVGNDQRHFDLAKARQQVLEMKGGDWLVLHVSELVALAYQISTGSFEKMRQIGVTLLCTIVDKFEKTEDPELPGHFLMEQYQAQLVSAVRTALDSTAGTILLDAGLQLATKILTSSITSGDKVVLQRMYTIISQPLENINDIHFPAFAEWVESKVKIRLLTAHAAVKACAYYHLSSTIDNTEYKALLPLISNNSASLGHCWIGILRDHIFLQTQMFSKKEYKPFLDGLRSPVIASVVQPCLSEVWPIMFLATSLDAVPADIQEEKAFEDAHMQNKSSVGCQYLMVKLKPEDFGFLWAIAFLILFDEFPKGHDETSLESSGSFIYDVIGRLPLGIDENMNLKFHIVALHALQSLSRGCFVHEEFLRCKLCIDLFQILMYPGFTLALGSISAVLSILEQVLKSCPDHYIQNENLLLNATELYMQHMHNIFTMDLDFRQHDDLVIPMLRTAKTLLCRMSLEIEIKVLPPMLHAVHNHILHTNLTGLINVAKTFMINMSSLMTERITAASSVDGDSNVMHQIEMSLVSFVHDAAQYCDNYLSDFLVKAHSTTIKHFMERLPQILEVMINLSRCILRIENSKSDCSFKKGFWRSTQQTCINCIRKTLSTSNMQIQMAGLHALKIIIQMAVIEMPKNECYKLANVFFGELLTDVFALIEKSLDFLNEKTDQVISFVGEIFKILLFLYSLIQEIQVQEDLVHLILHGLLLLATASERNASSQVEKGLRNISVKLVTHLVNVPSSASHCRNILIKMPEDSRQKLQEIIRASVTGEPASTIKTTLPISLPDLKHTYQPSKASEGILSHALSHADVSKNVDNEEEGNNFQAFPVSSTEPSGDVENNTVAEDMSNQEIDVAAEEWDEFQSFSESILATESTVMERGEDSKQTNLLLVSPTSDEQRSALEEKNSQKEQNNEAGILKGDTWKSDHANENIKTDETILESSAESLGSQTRSGLKLSAVSEDAEDSKALEDC